MKLAIIGDIHLHFNECDIDYFNRSDYDLILFVGDVANYSFSSASFCYRQISKIKKRALFLPGNHDAVNLFQLIGEISSQEWLCKVSSKGQENRVEKLREWISPVVLGGYTLHDFNIRGETFSVIACRPHSMGGNQFSFKSYLKRKFQVSNFNQSGVYLQCLMEKAKSERIIFLAHNGPKGLGDGKSDIWGCDFKKDGGDFGDQDLNLAIDYASSLKKKVLLVAAGHMHHKVKGAGESREWNIHKDGITYLNAAKVPRIRKEKGVFYHHHISVEIQNQLVMAEEKWIGFEPVNDR